MIYVQLDEVHVENRLEFKGMTSSIILILKFDITLIFFVEDCYIYANFRVTPFRLDTFL